MRRRDALKLLAGAAALPLLSGEAYSLFQAVHEQLPETAALRTLNPSQNSIVVAMSEVIIPQTETPGAKAVRVNEFIDLILTDWYDEPERTQFLAGLSNVNARSHDLFAKDFADCAINQQAEIVAALDEELDQLRDAELPGSSPRGGPPRVENNFFYMMKRLTLVGYFTSQVGFEQQLHKQIIPRTHSGCATITDETPVTN
jgi:Gluconate 2-dehydrogenase subunit 3